MLIPLVIYPATVKIKCLCFDNRITNSPTHHSQNDVDLCRG